MEKFLVNSINKISWDFFRGENCYAFSKIHCIKRMIDFKCLLLRSSLEYNLKNYVSLH